MHSFLNSRAKYDYRDAPPDVLAKTRQIETVGNHFGVPLKAAALQFVLAHPAVTSVIPGTSSLEHVEKNFQMVRYPIPPELWKKT